jgi:hypothetical protein
MARGGFRPGAGRPKSALTAREPAQQIDLPPDVKRAARKNNLSPLAYCEAVMNDEGADVARRDRLAIAALPFRHRRMSDEEPSKKEQRDATARKMDTGRFATPAAPKLVVDNA